MPPKKGAKRKAKAKAKVGSKKRPPPEEEDTLPDLGEAAASAASAAPPSSQKEAADDEDDDAPLSSMMPAAKVAKMPEPEGDASSPSLPSFAAAAEESKEKEDDDDQPMITGARLGQQTGAGGDDADGEGDIWHRLEKELQAPLHATPGPDAEDANVKGLPDTEDASDDDWGIKWSGSGSAGKELPGASDVLDEIAKKAAASTNWHRQEWVKKEEPADVADDEEEDQHDQDKYRSEQDKRTTEDDWQPDLKWISEDAFSNSREAMAVENVVRKIRARAGEKLKQSGMEPFPNFTMFQVLKTWVKRPLPDQRVLLTALLFVEAMTLDAEQPPPDLNSIGLSLLINQGKELDEMRNACKVAPPHLMLKKADSAIPDLKLRKEIVPQMIKQLKSRLSGLLSGGDYDPGEDHLGKTVDDMFVELPATVRMMGLVHCCEYVFILKQVWETEKDLLNSLGKQSASWRVFEVLCRLDIREACRLANQALRPETDPLRTSKIACLNRLASEWKLAPLEEDLMLLHMLGLERQIKVLLSIERDVELKWCDLMAKVDGREERSAKLREYLNFSERLRPYLNDEDLRPGTGRKPIEKESGQKLAIGDLAMVRQGVSDVLKKLKQLYRWKPDMNSRKVISKTNWVARLSAVLKLVKTTYTLSADKELRKILQIEAARTLGTETYKDYLQWRKTEQGDGLQRPRKRIASESALEDRKRSWEDLMKRYFPENVPQQTQYQPQTPAGLGVAAMTPGLAAMTPGLGAAMTPGLAAAMTPGLAPGTPGMGGAVTPGFRAPTPTGYSGFTPGFKENSEGNTPMWRPSATPLGTFGTGTPLPGGTPGRVNARTPFGQPPQTPLGAVKHDGTGPPVTPAGVPPATPSGPGAQPMTPPAEPKVKDVKAEP